MINEKEIKRQARHKRIRIKVSGTQARPRLLVHRSAKNLQLQLVDDTIGKTIFSMSTTGKEIKKKIPQGGNVKAADVLGGIFAGEAIGKGIKSVVFDRGGYLYHGRIKALAESLRKGGLEF
jgi:large subunit ribosomal protein L18